MFTKNNKLDIVMFCGSPGAGKSTFYWRHLQPLGYERVNQDILKSVSLHATLSNDRSRTDESQRDKCLKYAQAFLEEGTSVAVDNTNADEPTRAYWTTLAKKLNVPIRCVHFTASTLLAEHNDAVRALNDAAVGLNNISLIERQRRASHATSDGSLLSEHSPCRACPVFGYYSPLTMCT